MTVGDRPQGVAGDCNSLAETHAWFDSRVAHHSFFLKPPTPNFIRIILIFQSITDILHTRDDLNRL
jgi:hypothetical protein